jgi:hypothetical protein
MAPGGSKRPALRGSFFGRLSSAAASRPFISPAGIGVDEIRPKPTQADEYSNARTHQHPNVEASGEDQKIESACGCAGQG